MRVTVAIPTYRRGPLLRAALASVRNQSRPDLIAEVVVSENSDDHGSAAIVQEFPELPVRHIMQTPPVDPGTHFARLLEYVQTDLAAVLGDDDMWGRHHLEEAVRGLEQHPDCVAYISQDVMVRNQTRSTAGPGCFLPNAGADGRRETFSDCWVFGRREMAVACLVATPLNMWAVVGRREALVEAFKAFTEPHGGHDSDRYMLWLLAQQGPVVVGREIGLFSRIHGSNACARLLREEFGHQQRMAREYTRRMIADAEKTGLPLKEAWVAAMEELSDEERYSYLYWSIPGAKAAVAEAWPDELRRLSRLPPRTLSQIAYQLTPPFLWFWMLRLRNWVRMTIGR